MLRLMKNEKGLLVPLHSHIFVYQGLLPFLSLPCHFITILTPADWNLKYLLFPSGIFK